MQGRDTYQLTGSKMTHWHRHRADCSCGSVTDIIAIHLEPAGFRVVGPYNEISGPGLADGITDRLYEAVSGMVSHGLSGTDRR